MTASSASELRFSTMPGASEAVLKFLFFMRSACSPAPLCHTVICALCMYISPPPRTRAHTFIERWRKSSLRPLSSSEITMSLPKPESGRANAFTTALRGHGGHPKCADGRLPGYAPRTWVTLTFLAALANQRRLELALGGADKLAQCAFDLADLLGVFQRVLGVVHIHNADHDFLARAMSSHQPLLCQRAIAGHVRRDFPTHAGSEQRRGAAAGAHYGELLKLSGHLLLLKVVLALDERLKLGVWAVFDPFRVPQHLRQTEQVGGQCKDGGWWQRGPLGQRAR
jgi:hypothetical protein